MSNQWFFFLLLVYTAGAGNFVASGADDVTYDELSYDKVISSILNSARSDCTQKKKESEFWPVDKKTGEIPGLMSPGGISDPCSGILQPGGGLMAWEDPCALIAGVPDQCFDLGSDAAKMSHGKAVKGQSRSLARDNASEEDGYWKGKSTLFSMFFCAVYWGCQCYPAFVSEGTTIKVTQSRPTIGTVFGIMKRSGSMPGHEYCTAPEPSAACTCTYSF